MRSARSVYRRASLPKKGDTNKIGSSLFENECFTRSRLFFLGPFPFSQTERTARRFFNFSDSGTRTLRLGVAPGGWVTLTPLSRYDSDSLKFKFGVPKVSKFLYIHVPQQRLVRGCEKFLPALA